MNTRVELEQIIQRSLSSSTFRCVDDEWAVTGRHCRCAFFGNDRCDIWICTHPGLVRENGRRNVRAIAPRNLISGVEVLSRIKDMPWTIALNLDDLAMIADASRVALKLTREGSQ
jgi:hypothetical protein